MLQVFIETEEEDEKEDVAPQYTHISSCEEDQLARSCFLFNLTNCYVFKIRILVALDFLQYF